MPFKFYIQDLYDRTEVTEPRGWNGIVSVLERDFDVHGVFFKYTDGSVKLGFSCGSKTLLEAAYQADGSEAYYLFEVDEAENDLTTFTTIFSGELDFSTREFDEDYFNIDVNEINEIDKLKNRSSLKINLNKGLSLDGIDLGNINYDDSIYSLATKNFKQLIVKNTGETLDTVQSTAATTTSYLYANFGFTTIESEELKKYRQKSTRMNTSVITGDLLTLDEAGALDMNFDYDFDLNLTEDQGSGTTTYFATLSIKFDPPGGGVLDEIALDTENQAAASPYNTTLTFLGDIDQTISLEAGTKIWLELEIQQTSTGTTQMTCELDITKFDVTITDKIGILGTQAQWYHLHDALNKNLNFITNEYDYLYSELLGDLERGYSLDGCLSGMRITNGFRARQINDSDKAPIFSFKDFITNLNTIAAVGYGIEEIESPISLGINELFWVEISGGIAETRIMGVNFVYDIFTGSNIGFFNSEDIYGFYEITNVIFNPSYTTVFFDVTQNTNWYGGLFGNNPSKNTTFTDVFIVTDTTNEFRDRLRVEKWEHFYGDNELIDLGTVQEYSEEPFDDILYNELNIKFSKFSNDEEKSTTLEEIHTESGWALPLTKSDNNLSLVLQWIGSTFLFNESRERIFSKKPTTSHILDNNIFFCDKAEKEGVYTVDFNASTDKITMPADAYENIINGSIFFLITNAADPYNDGVHQIDTTQQIIFDITNNEYDVPVTSSLVAGSGDEVTIAHQQVFQKLFKPEANDLLSSSSGITRPTYIMNQRRTMKRFLIRWGRYVSSVLAYLVDSANVTIQNLFFINNGDFSSELDTSQLTSDCLMGDSSGALIREADNINSLALGTAKFKPNFIHGTVKICDEDFDRIKDAHKNRLDAFAILAKTSICTSPIKSDVSFIHQTGIFDITIVCALINSSSTTEFEYLLWNIGTGAEHGFSISYNNSFTSLEGQMYFAVGLPASASTFGWTDDIREFITGERQIFRFVGNGSSVSISIDGVSMDMISSSFTPGGSTDPVNDLYIGSGNISPPNTNHFGLYESVSIKNGAGEEIVQYNLTERQGNIIANEGTDAPIGNNASYAVLPSFSDNQNYGYLTMTSPNAKEITGWLMEIKRNPVDRIAKVKLLERAKNVGIFDGIVYGDMGYHAEFEIDDFELIIIGKLTQTTGTVAYFAQNQNGASGSRTGFTVLFVSSDVNLVLASDATTLYSISQGHGLSINDIFTLVIKKAGATVTFTVNGDLIKTDNAVPSIHYDTGETFVGARNLNGSPITHLTGQINSIELDKLNASGDFISNLAIIDFNNNNNVTVPNTGTNAPSGSDMIWN